MAAQTKMTRWLIRAAVVALLGVLVSPVIVRPAQAQACTLSDKLVPSCGLLLGAWSNNHGVGSGFKARLLEHEQRIGRQVRIVHNYHSPSEPPPLTADEVFFAARPNTIVWVNWWPAAKWADAAGGNATVNARIAAVADSIKGVAPSKIMLTIVHEPENDVLAGSTACPVDGRRHYGTAGTPADYRAMWRNVRSIFTARGSSNVVFNMNYMGYVPNWACEFKDLWPGNDLVDWVTWNPYSLNGSTETWDRTINSFYSWMSANNDATHDFLSKPWGVGEFGVGSKATRAFEYQYYTDAKAAIDAGRFSRLKYYSVYDAIGAFETRTNYDTAGVLNPTEQTKYNAFANDPLFLSS
jgi:hypothetical protein